MKHHRLILDGAQEVIEELKQANVALDAKIEELEQANLKEDAVLDILERRVNALPRTKGILKALSTFYITACVNRYPYSDSPLFLCVAQILCVCVWGGVRLLQ